MNIEERAGYINAAIVREAHRLHKRTGACEFRCQVTDEQFRDLYAEMFPDERIGVVHNFRFTNDMQFGRIWITPTGEPTEGVVVSAMEIVDPPFVSNQS